MSATRKKIVSTTKALLDTLALPALNVAAGVFARDANQDSRGLNNKDAIKHDASHEVSAIVVFSILYTAVRTLETMDKTWARLSTAERIAYSLFLLLSMGAFGYSFVESILDNPNPVLGGRAIPAAVGVVLAGVANAGATIFSQPTRHTEEVITEATPLAGVVSPSV